MTEAELYSVYKDVYLPHALYPPESLKYYEEFSFRPDDVIIVTYPKSGKWVSQVTLQVCNITWSPYDKKFYVCWKKICHVISHVIGFLNNFRLTN